MGRGGNGGAVSLKQAQDLGPVHLSGAGGRDHISQQSLQPEAGWLGYFWALGKGNLLLAHSSNSRLSPGPGEGDLVGENP